MGECKKHKKCEELKLEGYCCPAADGKMLDCCSQSDTVASWQPKDTGDGKKCSAHKDCSKLEGDCCPNKDGKILDCCEAECKKHKKCEELKLEGYCCPAADGKMLDCCSQSDTVAAWLPGDSEDAEPV